LVDNGSTDGTEDVARRSWGENGPAPLRIVHEFQVGVAHARQRGLDEARYQSVAFVDDDNWVSDDWVQHAAYTMLEDSEIGACGGFSEPVGVVRPPLWFDKYKSLYAIGPSRTSGVTDVLWTAGMVVRKRAWLSLSHNGFSFLTVSSGEDHELSMALRLAGWGLKLDTGLQLKHFLPAHRLTWNYFRRLQRARSEMAVALDPYYLVLGGPSGRDGEMWWYQVLLVTRALAQNLALRPERVLFRGSPRFEGDEHVVRIERYLGRLQGLLRCRSVYETNLRMLKSAPWHRALIGGSPTAI
jgi:Glycosyl transferase family 2